MSQKSTTDTNRFVRVMTIMAIATAVTSMSTCVSVKAAMGGRTAAIGITDKGGVLPLVTLDKVYVTEPRLVGFVEECMRKAFQHDFLHYRETTTAAQACFDPAGASSYAEAIDPLLKTMVKERRVMTSTIDRVPVVVRGPYKIDGVVAWDVQAQISLAFEGTKDRIPPTRYEASVLVTRVDLAENVRGVAIRRIGLAPARP